MSKKKKKEEPIKVDMSFDEAMERIARVKKEEVEKKPKKGNKK